MLDGAWGQLGVVGLAVALIALVVRMVLYGKLRTEGSVKEQLSDKNQQIEDWREAYRAERARGEIQTKQIDELLELSRTGVKLMSALAHVAPTLTEPQETAL